jgi:hypothetical protein
MPELIDDKMLTTFAVVADASALGPALAERYHGLADRLAVYAPFLPGERDSFWNSLLRMKDER